MDHSPFRHLAALLEPKSVQHCCGPPVNRLYGAALFCFAVGTVTAAETAILAQFQPVGRLLLIFLRVVIAAFTLSARHDNHYAILFFCHLQFTTNMK